MSDTEILARRARALARRTDADATRSGAQLRPVATARIGSTRIGIPLDALVAIVRVVSVTPLPRAVSPVLGITAWRGRPITVLSLDGRMPDGSSDQRLLMLGEVRRANVAILVDAVDDSADVDHAALSESMQGTLARYAAGTTADSMLILDTARIMDVVRPEDDEQEITTTRNA